MYLSTVIFFWVVTLILLILLFDVMNFFNMLEVLIAPIMLTIIGVWQIILEKNYHTKSYLKYDDEKLQGYNSCNNKRIEGLIEDVDIAIVGRSKILIEINGGETFELERVKDAQEHVRKIKDIINRGAQN